MSHIPGWDAGKRENIFLREENYVLKLLTYLLIRQYDDVFAKNLYSFRVLTLA